MYGIIIFFFFITCMLKATEHNDQDDLIHRVVKIEDANMNATFKEKKSRLRPPPIRTRIFNHVEEVDDESFFEKAFACYNSFNRFKVFMGLSFMAYIYYLINYSEISSKK
jgi:hypothetical protein